MTGPALSIGSRIHESAAITVEQTDDEIIVGVADVVCVYFQVTADQALRLSRALAVAAENAAKFLASTETDVASAPREPIRRAATPSDERALID